MRAEVEVGCAQLARTEARENALLTSSAAAHPQAQSLPRSVRDFALQALRAARERLDEDRAAGASYALTATATESAAGPATAADSSHHSPRKAALPRQQDGSSSSKAANSGKKKGSTTSPPRRTFTEQIHSGRLVGGAGATGGSGKAVLLPVFQPQRHLLAGVEGGKPATHCADLSVVLSDAVRRTVVAAACSIRRRRLRADQLRHEDAEERFLSRGGSAQTNGIELARVLLTGTSAKIAADRATFARRFAKPFAHATFPESDMRSLLLAAYFLQLHCDEERAAAARAATKGINLLHSPTTAARVLHPHLGPQFAEAVACSGQQTTTTNSTIASGGHLTLALRQVLLRAPPGTVPTQAIDQWRLGVPIEQLHPGLQSGLPAALFNLPTHAPNLHHRTASGGGPMLGASPTTAAAATTSKSSLSAINLTAFPVVSVAAVRAALEAANEAVAAEALRRATREKEMQYSGDGHQNAASAADGRPALSRHSSMVRGLHERSASTISIRGGGVGGGDSDREPSPVRKGTAVAEPSGPVPEYSYKAFNVLPQGLLAFHATMAAAVRFSRDRAAGLGDGGAFVSVPTHASEPCSSSSSAVAPPALAPSSTATSAALSAIADDDLSGPTPAGPSDRFFHDEAHSRGVFPSVGLHVSRSVALKQQKLRDERQRQQERDLNAGRLQSAMVRSPFHGSGNNDKYKQKHQLTMRQRAALAAAEADAAAMAEGGDIVLQLQQRQPHEGEEDIAEGGENCDDEEPRTPGSARYNGSSNTSSSQTSRLNSRLSSRLSSRMSSSRGPQMMATTTLDAAFHALSRKAAQSEFVALSSSAAATAATEDPGVSTAAVALALSAAQQRAPATDYTVALAQRHKEREKAQRHAHAAAILATAAVSSADATIGANVPPTAAAPAEVRVASSAPSTARGVPIAASSTFSSPRRGVGGQASASTRSKGKNN
jgi:hypothetical protein